MPVCSTALVPFAVDTNIGDARDLREICII